MQRSVALITGAAQGIGRSIARRLASDGGYHLALNDLPAKEEKLHELAEEVGGTVQVGDVSKERDVRRMIDETVKELGGLDVMVANAGVGVVKPLSQTTETDWDYVFSVHGRGVFLCYKHAAEQMIKQGRGGRIIGASSAAGKRGDMNMAAISSSKFTVRGLTQCAAMEYGKHGITVNAYAPGMIKTEMVTSLPPAKFEAAFQTYVSRTALQRPGEMTEIASLVAYLASKEAGYITGQTISIDGGGNFD
ncbi:hypothetical protein Moror_10941 [Moniliophthora roreri MCA 2997]|uniref:Acetoin reductase family protein n=1 Tax=Moniliophthora roreri (strain MCA 2997) TaxID=1381753 RepID=V2Y4X2_MONRO|nr:hypothetical protein Moror_10941 [Moniliophthora roreri MCA 2997]